MHAILDQILHFLQQGIAAIFRFVGLIWSWSVDQIGKLAAVPWQDWPLLKIILLIVVVVAVVWALFHAVWELWRATERILAAFATLLVALVHTFPSILLAGGIPLGGVGLLHHSDQSTARIPAPLPVGAHPPPPAPPPAPH